MSTSKLKLNPDKTEFIIFGSKRQRDKLNTCFPVDILGSPLCPVDSVKNLGVWFDSDFSLSKHVQNVCKGCFVQLHDFRHVRQFLTHDASVVVANALVSSQLDYCNSLFGSLSKFILRKLQCIQNSAARITPALLLSLRNCVGYRLIGHSVQDSQTCLQVSSHRFSLVFGSISFFLQEFL